ncbi:hypothetical protein ALP29_201705 [Pseudomonas syringae pv. avii]|uniref:Uncharacterized protein n=1 Tax=Pseudomonas syringae pv. avii TaxID=663959 RepID=A0A3M5VLY1_PSESX|nr:hypothetical protein ALP29_201705 [Pseudomonas syringae pv. avii]
MASGLALDRRPAEITFQIGKGRTFNVALRIVTLAVIRIFQGKATIENDQTRRFLAHGQAFRADQLRNGHDTLLWQKPDGQAAHRFWIQARASGNDE